MFLSELCASLAARGVEVRLEGADREVEAVNTLQDAVAGQLSFLSNPRYAPLLRETAATAVLVGEDMGVPDHIAALRTSDPYVAVTHAVVLVHGHRRHPSWGIHAEAHVDPTAQVGEGANLAPGSSVAAGAILGANCTLYPGSYVGENARLGDGCTLYPNAVVYDGCQLGERCALHSGTVVGQDGLGYAPVDGRWLKIPQVGIVEVGDDVEIGANCSIDRATLGKTVVGSGTKFGNGNVIGHGTRIGSDGIFVGLVGIAGSVTIGDGVTFAGQSGSVGHIEIANGASVAAQSMCVDSVPEGAKVLGSPAQPLVAELRSVAAHKRLPELLRTVARLEREVSELRAEVERRDEPARD